MNFDECFTKLLGNEGGYTVDNGGPTNWGVTEAVARQNGYTGDMRDFTQEQAKAIYKKSYWDAISADKLPADIRFHVFDAAVNSGVAQAIRWLQRAVGAEADGVIGPATLGAIKYLPSAVIVSKYNGHRLLFMAGLKVWPLYSAGWARRIANNLLEA